MSSKNRRFNNSYIKKVLLRGNIFGIINAFAKKVLWSKYKLHSSFETRLREELQISQLRPIQKLALESITSWKSSLIIAPTASGKTEAAFFPLLSMMLENKWEPVSILYIAPQKALLDNQLPRIKKYANLCNANVFLWHGDIDRQRKKNFIDKPTNILMTTPESLEVILAMEYKFSTLNIRNIKAVIIDEVHSFIASQRGAQLLSQLDRILYMSNNDFLRIALSATVGNPETIMKYINGASKKKTKILYGDKDKRDKKISVHHTRDHRSTVSIIAKSCKKKKVLVFCDNRETVEKTGIELKEYLIETKVIHSSLPGEYKKLAGQAFVEKGQCAIVSTSCMELGVDTADLEDVFQIEAPTTVSSLLQRMGRSGRRETLESNFSILCFSPEAIKRAMGLLLLYKEDFIESLYLPSFCINVLVQQILLLISSKKINFTEEFNYLVNNCAPFKEIRKNDLEALLKNMENLKIIKKTDAGYNWGKEGLRFLNFFQRKNFFSAFNSARYFCVLANKEFIGELDPLFVYGKEAGKFKFSLGARVWLAESINWKQMTIKALLVPGKESSIWTGGVSLISFEVSNAIKRVLCNVAEPPFLGVSAQKELIKLRSEYEFLRENKNSVVRQRNETIVYTFAGDNINRLFAFLLERNLDSTTYFNHEKIGFSESKILPSHVIEVIEKLKKQKSPYKNDQLQCASVWAKAYKVKFGQFILSELENIHVAEMLTDLQKTREIIKRPLTKPGGIKKIVYY